MLAGVYEQKPLSQYYTPSKTELDLGRQALVAALSGAIVDVLSGFFILTPAAADDSRARVVTARECLEDGDHWALSVALEELELDLFNPS